MTRWFTWAAGVGALMLAAPVPASAQTAGGTLLQASNGPIVDGSWTVSLSGCTVKSATGSTVSCNGTDEVIPAIAGDSLSLVFEAANGGSLETAAAGQFSDLTFTTITASYSGSKVGGSFVNVTGTGDGSFGSDVTVNEGTVSGGGAGAHTTLANSPTLQSVSFTSVTTATASSVDIKTNAVSLTSGQIPSGLTMTTATVGFTAVPEPLSASVLAVGAGAMALLRRKRPEQA